MFPSSSFHNDDISTCSSDDCRTIKLNPQTFMKNLKLLTDDPKTHDTTFVIQGKTEITGVKCLFANASPVFKRMFYGNMIESQNISKVHVDDILPEDFQWIVDYIHYRSPVLNFQNVIDVLMVADKYLIQELISQCKHLIFSINTPYNFFYVIHGINKYAPIFFNTLFNKLIKKTFIQNNAIFILKHDQLNTSIEQTQIMINELIRDEEKKYLLAKHYCQKKHENWKSTFKQYFQNLINYNFMGLAFLTGPVLDDKIFTESDLLEIIKKKTNKTLINTVRFESIKKNNYGPIIQKGDHVQFSYLSRIFLKTEQTRVWVVIGENNFNRIIESQLLNLRKHDVCEIKIPASLSSKNTMETYRIKILKIEKELSEEFEYSDEEDDIFNSE